jgi:hypothetical protein
MEGFQIRLCEITPEEELKLCSWARPRCKKFKILKKEYETIFVGVLRFQTDLRQFRKTMRANTSNWGILHVPNDTWVDDLSLHKYNVLFDYEQHQRDLLAEDHAIYDRVMRESKIKQAARNKRHQGFVDGLQKVKQADRLTTQSIFNVFAETLKLRKDQERQAMDLINTHKRERFREELDKLSICTSLPFDCSNYEDLEDIAPLREIVAQKRRRV